MSTFDRIFKRVLSQRSELIASSLQVPHPHVAVLLSSCQLSLNDVVRLMTFCHLFLGEYCNLEAFEPECNTDEVIMMQYAQFGRMKLGRCIEDDLGLSQYMG